LGSGGLVPFPHHLAEALRALAAQRGVTIEEIGERALTIGLSMLSDGTMADVVDIGVLRLPLYQPPSSVPMRSPIRAIGLVRTL
jgi:hypothetical protein